MSTRSKMLVLVISMGVLFSGTTVAGHSAEQLANAGWDCFAAGPNDWIHCMDLDKLIAGRPVVPVKVFSVDGSEFLGTELLLHGDIYAGQPCPQDDLDLWAPLDGTPYFACHHFSTGHH